MICEVCKNRVDKVSFCPRCQFRLKPLSSVDMESDAQRWYRALEYRKQIMESTFCGIYVYEWGNDTSKRKPELLNKTMEYFPEMDDEDPRTVYWMDETFASRKGNKGIELNLFVRQNSSVFGKREKDISIEIEYTWERPDWKVGIQCDEKGDMILCLGETNRYASKRIINIFDWR